MRRPVRTAQVSPGGFVATRGEPFARPVNEIPKVVFLPDRPDRHAPRIARGRLAEEVDRPLLGSA